MIRITGGTHRSRLLDTPNTGLTKPTMDKVRSAVFSALGYAVEDAEILDLFAGSGSYGLEAISRGAKSVTFVDKQREALNIIKSNIKKLGIAEQQIVSDDALKFLSETEQKFDIIFVDPPYKLEVYEEIVNIVNERNLLNTNGILVLESERELQFNKDLFKDVRFYKYGLAKIYINRK